MIIKNFCQELFTFFNPKLLETKNNCTTETDLFKIHKKTSQHIRRQKNVSFQTILIIVSNIIVPCFYEYDYNHNL